MTTIEWTHVPDGKSGRKKGETINPQVGCREKSPGCRNCYAAKQAAREMSSQHRGLTRSLPLLDANGKPVLDKRGRAKIKPNSTHWNGEIRRVPERLEQVLKWRQSRGIFWGSMTDLFIESNMETEQARRFVAACFGVMAATPQHTHMVLTKRPEIMRRWFEWLDVSAREWREAHDDVDLTTTTPATRWRYLFKQASDAVDPVLFADLVHRGGMGDWMDRRWDWPLPNVWIGTTTEDQKRADERIPDLLATPAAVRFLSVEPMVGPVDLNKAIGGTRWIGGQRGCAGEHRGDGSPGCPRELHHHHDDRCARGIDWVICGGESGQQARPMHPAWVGALRDQCVAAGVPFFFKQWGGRSPKAGGRLLDGRTWDEMPAPAGAA